MGYDVYGVKSKSETGNYFRNNVWWWRPLWNYVCENCEDIMNEDDMDAGCWNDGKRIVSGKCIEIADRLQTLIDEGHCLKYEAKYEAEREQIKKDNKDNELAGSYPFSTENVQSFVNFLRESGGIEIF